MATMESYSNDFASSRRLRLLFNLADIAGSLGAFWIVIKYRLDVTRYFENVSDLLLLNSWHDFLREQGGLCVTAVAVFASYYLGKREGKRMLELAGSLFVREQRPKKWGALSWPLVLPSVIIGYLINMLLMAWFIDKFFMFNLLIAIVYVLGLITNMAVRANLRKYLNDPKLAPLPDHPDYAHLIHRRNIANEYMFCRWHQTREMFALAGCIVAFLVAWYSPNLGYWPSYLVIIGIVVLNEIVLLRWRNARDAALGDE